MSDADGTNCSRRKFVRNALSATAVTFMGGGIGQRAEAQMAAQNKVQNSGLTSLSLSEASQLVRSRKVSPVELTQACLERIERLNPKLNAFITVTGETALAEARAAEAEIQHGQWRGPLCGIPMALKDLFDTAGVRTTAASALFKDRIPAQDAEVVRRLKASGAVLLGKLNMHEFAYGGSSVISYFGPVRNPWALDHIAGGSSAGSAAAMAAELCYGTLGSDTGGSIRQPSAYCGTVGLKPTYGRVSTRGVIPLSWLYDHVGPMTRTVADAALMLQVLAGYDPEDTNSIDIPLPDYSAALRDVKGIRIGIPRKFFYEGLDPEIESAMNAMLAITAKLRQSDIEMPASNDTTILRAEAYTYHYENIRKSPELYQTETLRRIRSAEDLSMVTYVQARRQVDQFRRAIHKTFETVDVLITPTTPVPPFIIAELLADVDNLRAREILSLRNTRPFNILGLPTISIPCGFTKAGLPIGMQISGRPGGEEDVLRVAHVYEQATDWHKKRPGLEA